MRGFAFGLIVIVGLAAALLSIRPGGLRRQLGLVARRFRIVLVLSGIWVFATLGIRLAFGTGPAADYGPGLLAVLLLIVFLFIGRDPKPP